MHAQYSSEGRRLSIPQMIAARLIYSRSSPRQYRSTHILNDVICELTGADLRCTRHQAFEIVCDRFLLYGAFEAAFDQVSGFVPSQILEHHDARENHRAGIDYIFVGILGSGAVSGFEYGVTIADIRSGRNSQPSNLR